MRMFLEYRFPWKPEMQPPKLERLVLPSRKLWLTSNRKQPISLMTTTAIGRAPSCSTWRTQIPAVAEPWYLAFNAKVSFRPVMNPQDLATAGPSITKAGQQYGK